jgi:hypothetical protein
LIDNARGDVFFHTASSSRTTSGMPIKGGGPLLVPPNETNEMAAITRGPMKSEDPSADTRALSGVCPGGKRQLFISMRRSDASAIATSRGHECRGRIARALATKIGVGKMISFSARVSVAAIQLWGRGRR